MDVFDEEEDEEAIMATEGDELGPPLLLAVGAGLARDGSTAARAGGSGDGGGSRTAAEGTADGMCCVGDCTAGRDLWSGTCGGESPLLRLILGKSQGRSQSLSGRVSDPGL